MLHWHLTSFDHHYVICTESNFDLRETNESPNCIEGWLLLLFETLELLWWRFVKLQLFGWIENFNINQLLWPLDQKN